MVLEQLEALKKAIAATSDEIVEEAELILEGSDPKASASLIITIMKELRSFSETIEIAESDIESTDSPYLFRVGDRVILNNDGFVFVPGDYLFEEAEVEKSKEFSGALFGDSPIGTIVSSFDTCHTFAGVTRAYIVECDGKKGFIHETFLKKA